ncbi:hypothetical protein D3C73_995000 [compost metagenome]
MFKFVLKNPSEIAPWGKDTTLMLHWFGLTDSYYWLDFGDGELLRYSFEFVEFYKLNKNLPYVDYQFARVFWDLTGIIRTVLSSIPDEVFDKIRTFSNFESYVESLSDWLEHKWSDSDEDYDAIYLPARQWIDDRKLDFGYLIGAPSVHLFRNNDQVYIRWTAEYKDSNGINMWGITKGESIVEFEKFISELLQSLKKFAIAMDSQLKSILDNPIENVFIDMNQLLKNHEEFLEEIKSYEKILSFVSDQTDWENVMSKIKIISQPFSSLGII